MYGKIKQLEKTDGTMISYTYDAGGNRISKAVSREGTTTTTWYVRDAQGNPMGIYTGEGESLTLTEQPLYGSSRLGIWNRHIDMDAAVDPKNYTFERGNKIFELSNHLGNVLATVSDKKIGVDSDSDGDIDYYTADVMMATDYYPGGMQQPGRIFNTQSYAYGFNGKRKDNEMYGEGNAYGFDYRILDPRLGGRWLSVDPLQHKYPGESPYLYTGGNPIIFADPDGRDRIIKTTVIGKDGKSSTITRVDKDFFLYREVDRPGFGNNTYYKADLEINLTIDLSKGITSYHEQEGAKRSEISQGAYQLHRAGVFFSKIAGGTDSDIRGRQPGGLTLTSEFSTNGDGVKTDATKGSSGSINIDLIMVAASTFSLPVNALGTNIKDLPEWTSMVKDAVDAYNNIKEDQKSESVIGNTNVTLDKTPSNYNPKPPQVVIIVKKERQFSAENDGDVITTSGDPAKPDTVRKYRYYDKPKHQSNEKNSEKKKAF